MKVFCRENGKLIRVKCNGCGKELWHLDGGSEQEEYISVDHRWGYFSDKDGESHHFDLCESCYDKWIHTFQIPVEIQQETELL